MERILRVVALTACVFLVASCGPQEKTDRQPNPGNGTPPGSGDATGESAAACGEGVATVTGILGTRNIGLSARINDAKFQAPIDTTPGWLTLTLDDGFISLQFVNTPTQGGTVAARGVVYRTKDEVTVGHCDDSVYSAQLALSSETARRGAFYLTGLYGHDGAACDKQPVAGTLSGCFYY